MNRTDTCTQYIWVRNPDLFDEEDIIWPYDTTIAGCGANIDPKNLPDTFGYPIIQIENVLFLESLLKIIRSHIFKALMSAKKY